MVRACSAGINRAKFWPGRSAMATPVNPPTLRRSRPHKTPAVRTAGVLCGRLRRRVGGFTGVAIADRPGQNLARLIPAEHALTIGTEGYAPDSAGVPLQRQHLLPLVGGPDAHR